MSEFEDVLRRAVPVHTYIACLSENYKPRYEERRRSYTPKANTLDALRQFKDDFVILVIGASWCKDCVLHIPVLDLISEGTDLRVKVLGGVKTDPLNPDCLWAVPPSPPEVNTLCITHIPTILVYTTEGKEVGRIVEHPKNKATLEEELLHIMTEATL